MRQPQCPALRRRRAYRSDVRENRDVPRESAGQEIFRRGAPGRSVGWHAIEAQNIARLETPSEDRQKSGNSITAVSPDSIHALIERGRSGSLRSERCGQSGMSSRSAKRAQRQSAARRSHHDRTGLSRSANNPASRENESGTSIGIPSVFVGSRDDSGCFGSIRRITDEFRENFPA